MMNGRVVIAASFLMFFAAACAQSKPAVAPPQNTAREHGSAPETAERSGVREVTVRVDGMACPFCAYNIEKRVKMLDGVDPGAPIVVSVREGLVRIPWNRAVPFDPDALRDAIKKAGFSPGEIKTIAVATGVRENE